MHHLVPAASIPRTTCLNSIAAVLLIRCGPQIPGDSDPYMGYKFADRILELPFLKRRFKIREHMVKCKTGRLLAGIIDYFSEFSNIQREG